MVISAIQVLDRRFDLPNGSGSDATHTSPQYAYAVCVLKTDTSLEGIGLAFTLGAGTELVCQAIQFLSEKLVGQEIEA